MTILGFNYNNVISSIADQPITFKFDKEHKKIICYYVTNLDFFVIKEEIELVQGQDVFFIYNNGIIGGYITKIDYEKKRIRIGNFWVSEKDEIFTIGLNYSFETEEDE